MKIGIQKIRITILCGKHRFVILTEDFFVIQRNLKFHIDECGIICYSGNREYRKNKKKKFQNSGMDTLRGFVRAMIFEGYIVHIDENELKRLTVLANTIANNINQIAHRANVTNKVYKEDIEEIKELGDKLWRPLMFLQTKVVQLKH
jgi:hypothetical protein